MFPKRKPRVARLAAVGDIDWADGDDNVPPGITSAMFTLRGLMRSADMFAVPPYQRAYSWQDEQVEKLLDDTLTACEAGQRSYLLGTMVLQRIEDGPLLVVDGYQRLMTLTLILSHLRDAKADAELSTRLQTLIAPGGRGRLMPRRADHTLVRDCVQHPGRLARLSEATTSLAQRRLAAASKLIGQTLETAAAEEAVRYANFLCRRITLNVIEADNAASAGALFRVLAERGLKMPESALVKSQLLVRSGLSAEEADDLSDRWDKLEDDLGENAFEDFLKVTPQILTADIALKRAPDLSFFYDGAFSADQARRFVRQEVWSFADVFMRLNAKEIDGIDADPEIKRFLKCLLLYREKHWMAPAIDYLANHPIDTDDALAFLRGLDRVMFLRAMGGLPENRVRPRFSRILAAHGDMSVLAAPGMLELTEHERATLIRNINESMASNEHRRRIVTLRANASLEGGAVLVEAGSDGTVEHIKPQADTAYWIKKFPDAKLRSEFTHLLGNFTILSMSQNKDAANLPFEEKLVVYRDRKWPQHALTRSLDGVSEWNALELMRRHEMLVHALCQDLGIV